MEVSKDQDEEGSQKIRNRLGITGRTLGHAVENRQEFSCCLKGKFWLCFISLAKTSACILDFSTDEISFKIMLGTNRKLKAKLKDLLWESNWSMKCMYSDTLTFCFYTKKQLIGSCDLSIETINVHELKGIEKCFELYDEYHKSIPGLSILIKAAFDPSSDLSRSFTSSSLGQSMSSVSFGNMSSSQTNDSGNKKRGILRRRRSTSALSSQINHTTKQSQQQQQIEQQSQPHSHFQGVFSRLFSGRKKDLSHSHSEFNLNNIHNNKMNNPKISNSTSSSSIQSHSLFLSSSKIKTTPTPSTQSTQPSSLPEQELCEKISSKDLTVNSILGRGGSGQVVQATWHGHQVAIKRFNCDSENSNIFSTPQEFLTEVEALRKLRHPNIVTFYGYLDDNEGYGIVVEYLKLGNLENALRKENRRFPADLQIKFMLDIARGLRYLHNLSVIHRDMKPANILIKSYDPNSSEVNCKLCDFGIAKQQTLQVNTSGRGTPKYMAPEQYGSDHVTVKIDIYSVGLIMWELITGKEVFDKYLFPFELRKAVCENKERPHIPAWVQPQLSDLIQNCWAQDPAVRPTSSELFEALEGFHDINLNSRRKGVSNIQPIPSSTRSEEGEVKRDFWVGEMNLQTQYVYDTLKRGSTSWIKFQAFLSSNFFIDPVLLKPLKPLLVDPVLGDVTIQRLKKLLGWFCPLLPEKGAYQLIRDEEDDEDEDSFPHRNIDHSHFDFNESEYQNNERFSQIENTNSSVYTKQGNEDQEIIDPTLFDPQKPGCTLSSLCAFLSRDWFHGFIEYEEAELRLKGRTPGTFLVRFSKKIGMYILAVVVADGSITQFEISPCIGGGYIFGRRVVVRSLFDLINIYRSRPIPQTKTYLFDTVMRP